MGASSGGSPSASLNLENHASVAQRAFEGSLLERLNLPQTNIRMMPLEWKSLVGM